MADAGDLTAASSGALAEKIKEWTPEMMMHSFKVELCTDEAAHDWLECPYAHRGEKAARRDPATHNHVGVICPDIRRSGRCPRGDSCPYAHSVFELHLHPNRYRTQLCTMGASCRRPVCFFAHTVEEMRSPPEGASAAPGAPPGGAGAPVPPPRGLSFDLSADGGAAAAAAMRAAAAAPVGGRASLESSAAAAAAAAAAMKTTSFGALGSLGRPAPATPAALAAPGRPPAGRMSFDALVRPRAVPVAGRQVPPQQRSSLDESALRRLSLPSLLPAELGFTADDSSCGSASDSPVAESAPSPGLGSVHGSGAALAPQTPPNAAPWLAAGAHHPQQVRAAIALLERGSSSDASSSASSTASPSSSAGGRRRAGLDGGSRPPPSGGWGATTAAQPGAPAQQMLSALLVQQQCEQMAAQQCEQIAAQQRDRLAAHQHLQAAQAAQQQQQALQHQQAQQHLAAHQQAQQMHLRQQQIAEQQKTVALSALWLQERRAAAAAAAAVHAAQQETNALAALRWGLAMQQQLPPEVLAGMAAAGAAAGGEMGPAGAPPDLMALASHLHLMRAQMT
ncbi:Zinc finger CCCH domain-containing protein 2 [Monoraphidium neglectum]|uniref:Zinc finger CCCH domain-containing protein 2 n=1 Tax=Monoraphidium neglectum TaxID=145388 RepID=A0A0D2JVQ2_9CHLO|nr:Zinc finger CCCH domain-containing protein 2 [Monoraphidium neglectum]KIZ02848.1 Zinc finger CCCH domain-containing protein 2 [Monoraphidium neglectum]|eukprot:XP_013901867.1 Zinc finger CCCH domain-containing protein 2 [Monoraphidium neglectum]